MWCAGRTAPSGSVLPLSVKAFSIRMLHAEYGGSPTAGGTRREPSAVSGNESEPRSRGVAAVSRRPLRPPAPVGFPVRARSDSAETSRWSGRAVRSLRVAACTVASTTCGLVGAAHVPELAARLLLLVVLPPAAVLLGAAVVVALTPLLPIRPPRPPAVEQG